MQNNSQLLQGPNGHQNLQLGNELKSAHTMHIHKAIQPLKIKEVLKIQMSFSKLSGRFIQKAKRVFLPMISFSPLKKMQKCSVFQTAIQLQQRPPSQAKGAEGKQRPKTMQRTLFRTLSPSEPNISLNMVIYQKQHRLAYGRYWELFSENRLTRFLPPSPPPPKSSHSPLWPHLPCKHQMYYFF